MFFSKFVVALLSDSVEVFASFSLVDHFLDVATNKRYSWSVWSQVFKIAGSRGINKGLKVQESTSV
jgi:hypothetical protein